MTPPPERPVVTEEALTAIWRDGFRDDYHLTDFVVLAQRLAVVPAFRAAIVESAVACDTEDLRRLRDAMGELHYYLSATGHVNHSNNLGSVITVLGSLILPHNTAALLPDGVPAQEDRNDK